MAPLQVKIQRDVAAEVSTLRELAERLESQKSTTFEPIEERDHAGQEK
tara:strand:- start:2779 stop:2922 length:144 start_codon:yes stop_codon:yes gene_type:complete